MMCLVFVITRIELTIIVIIVIFVHDNNCIAKYQYRPSLEDKPIFTQILVKDFDIRIVKLVLKYSLRLCMWQIVFSSHDTSFFVKK